MKKKKLMYNQELLKQFIDENNVRLIGDYFDKNNKINREAKIKGYCKTVDCNKEFERTFRMMYNMGGPYCESCKNNNCKEKYKGTCMEKYGFENGFQSQEVKEKSKLSCLKKYGTEYAMQNKEMLQKKHSTCLKKYGSKHPSQNQEVKEKARKTCLERYGVENPLQNAEIMQKARDTMMGKYGVDHNFKLQSSIDKRTQTWIENYGVDHPLKNEGQRKKMKATIKRKYNVDHCMHIDEVKEKQKQTLIINHGVENPMYNEDIKEKLRQTNLEKYGVDNVFQNKEIKQKIKDSNLEKYGFESAMQNSEVSEKSSKNAYLAKDYQFPSGKKVKIQGYEHFGIDELLNIEKINEDDIITKRTEVPKIWYLDIKNKKHRHYVDIFIPSQNRCVEIKSVWTYQRNKDKVTRKKKAAIDLGYLYDIWVFNPKGEKIMII